MEQRHPSQRVQASSCALPRRTRCHNQLQERWWDKTSLHRQIRLANLKWRMARGQRRTRYRAHRNLGCIQRAVSHQGRRQQLLHSVRNTPECDVPTRVGARYTSHAYCRSSRSNEETSLLAQSLRDHHGLHRQQPLQVAQLLRTTAWRDVVQLLCRNESSDQRREYMDVFRQRCGLTCEVLQLLLCALQNDPCHQSEFQS